MKRETGTYSAQDKRIILVPAHETRPVVELLLEMVKQGIAALPKFISTPGLEDIVEKGLKNPDKLYDLLRKEVNKSLPVLPKLPPLIIMKGK